MASNEEIKRQIALRGVQKGRITRIKHYIDAYSIQDRNFQMLQVKHNNLMNAWHKYDECQLFLETNCENEDNDRINLEDTVDELRSKIQKLLDSKNEAEISNNKSLDNSSVKNNSNVILPQINLPIFDGSYGDWLSFSEFFKVLVHDNANLTTIQKFHYLTSSLTGQAKQLIKNLSLTPDNYKVAWILLENRYANKRLIASNHANDVINITSLPKESAHGLASFIDKVSSNINALKALDINFSEFILLQTLSRRLDPNTNRAWESSLSSDEFPSIDEFISFLEKRRQILENTCNSIVLAHTQNKAQPIKGISNFPKQYSQIYNAQTESNFDKRYTCLCCQENHALHKCHKFCNMTINDRLFFIKHNRLCFNCFNRNHVAKECNNTYRCKICNSNHHTLVHFDRPVADQTPSKCEIVESGGSYCGLKTQKISRVLLATAVVTVQDRFNQPVRCRALLDPGSQANFVSESLAHRLSLKRESADLSIAGINNISTRAKHNINVTMSSLCRDFSANLICFVLPKITGEIPSSDIDISHWTIPNEIKLADKDFNISGKIDLLVGAEIFWQLLTPNQIIQGNDFPVLQETKLGWIISGRLPERDSHQLKEITSHVASLTSNSAKNLQCQLQKFWEIEEVSKLPCRSKEDEFCEKHFRENTIKDKSGRFVVKLPRRLTHPSLGKSLLNAEIRFFNLERKLSKNQKLKCDYAKFMNEYLELDHMQRIENTYSNSESNTLPYYLPHHAVFKESSSTTKTRVVFDASAKTSNNISLNDILLTGPTIQQEIISIILRFRTHAYVMTADITKMYRQIRVHPENYDLQRILWRDDSQQEVGHYQLKTVTYGTAPAAFLATRCLAQLAEENAEAFPLASEIIKRDFYVDDLQTGGDNIKQVKQLQEDISKILESSGFHLHKWCSNDKRLIEHIPQNKREVNTSIALEEEKTIKTLGLLWDHENDIFKFDIRTKPLEVNYTKRMVLSVIASIYDILGLLGPFVTACKIFIQRLWLHNLNWDDRLPEDLRNTWIELYKQIPMLKKISIPRFVKSLGKIVSIHIHGFSDASESAYGACIYLRTVNSNGDVSVKLLCSKSRVAPIKQISLPRLELCGAVILSKLVKRIIPILCLTIEDVYLWTDSTVVLAWLSATPTKWKTFVGNRVSDIQCTTENYH